jgi:hypothetical protein
MNRDKTTAEEKKEKIIPGIHNYCDRWCERCAFTSRCLSFALEKRGNKEKEARDMSNQKFWNQLSETFQMTRKLIKQAAEEQGIDLEKIDTSQGDELQQKSHEYAAHHPLALTARSYSKMTSSWFYQVSHLFSIVFNEKGNCLTVIPAGPQPGVQIEDVENAVSVIRWYQFQISAKLMRALNGVIMEQEDLLWNDYPKDSDGSAKVSLIGIDRSINAWEVLLRNYSSEENGILDVLVILERLKKDIEKEFPRARQFKRPGFDDSQGKF